jgi:hypothetical protein
VVSRSSATERTAREIPVIFCNGEDKTVPATMLDALIRGKRIVAFLRSDGWVQVDRDPIRKARPPMTRSGLGDYQIVFDQHPF